jgi:hypothetical protein
LRTVQQELPDQSSPKATPDKSKTCARVPDGREHTLVACGKRTQMSGVRRQGSEIYLRDLPAVAWKAKVEADDTFFSFFRELEIDLKILWNGSQAA